MLASEERNPAVVVMLTQTHEAGREKCFQYYPLSPEEPPLQIPPDDEEGEGGWKGEVRLESIETDTASRSEVRRMRLQAGREGEGTEELEIRHLLFSGWPDFLIPEGEDKTALLELVRLSASLNRPTDETDAQPNGATAPAHDLLNTSENPRIVHCSAGVGRSGTFIALDYLLSLLYSNELDNIDDDKDPIAEIVDDMRKQRMMMVQGESQFNFLYEVLKEQMVERLQASGGAEQDGS